MLPKWTASKPVSLSEESDIPIIMLTARGEVTDKVVGLELGPTITFLNRLNRGAACQDTTVWRRTEPKLKSNELVKLKNLSSTQQKDGIFPVKIWKLTSTEYELLSICKYNGKVLSRDEIMQNTWYFMDVFDRSVDVMFQASEQV
jgi:OmpR family response regulator RpaB